MAYDGLCWKYELNDNLGIYCIVYRDFVLLWYSKNHKEGLIMALQEIIDKVKEMRANKESKEEIPDDVTRDKQLRSLRRMRRVQNEEIEKEKLTKEVAEFNLARTRRHMFGIKSDLEKKIEVKKFSLLKGQVDIMKGKKKKAVEQKMSFLEKSNL